MLWKHNMSKMRSVWDNLKVARVYNRYLSRFPKTNIKKPTFCVVEPLLGKTWISFLSPLRIFLNHFILQRAIWPGTWQEKFLFTMFCVLRFIGPYAYGQSPYLKRFAALSNTLINVSSSFAGSDMKMTWRCISNKADPRLLNARGRNVKSKYSCLCPSLIFLNLISHVLHS